MTNYTCESARKFDPLMRQQAKPYAIALFNQVAKDLSKGATYENIEFDVECDCSASGYSKTCRIRAVTVRRRSDGTGGEDVVSVPLRQTPHLLGVIRDLHNAAFC